MIIVTGGAGFIGSNLVKGLNRAGKTDIMIVDHLGSGDKWKNLVGLKYLKFMDKCDFAKVIEGNELKNVEIIFHLGGCSTTKERNADYLMGNNFNYSRKLLDWCLKNGSRFIYASSAAVYGNGESGWSDDWTNDCKFKPLNMYGYSKLLMDNYAMSKDSTAMFLGVQCVGLRFFNVYGPGEDHKGEMASVIKHFVKQVKETGTIKLFKSNDYKRFEDGEQIRTFTHVDDCVNVMLFLYGNQRIKGTFNVPGQQTTFNDIARIVFKAMKKPLVISYIDMPEDLKSQYQNYTESDCRNLMKKQYNIPLTEVEFGVKSYVKILVGDK